MIADKVNLTPIDAMDQRGSATTLEGAGELAMLRHHVVETMRVLQPLIKRSRAATGNPNYSSEAGRAAAVALTKLEEALMWAERGQNVRICGKARCDMRQQIICGQCKHQVDECCKDQFRCERWLNRPVMPYQDKGGRLNGPDDKALAARELAAAVPRGDYKDAAEPDKPTVTDAALSRYGYAPGHYTLRCKRCGEVKPSLGGGTRGFDKGASTCRECAEALYWHDVVKERENTFSVAEPPIVVSSLDDAYKVDLKPGALSYVGKPYEKTPRESELEEELEAAQEEQREANRMLGEALDLAERRKEDCLKKAWDRISELQKQIVAYDKQLETLRSKTR